MKKIFFIAVVLVALVAVFWLGKYGKNETSTNQQTSSVTEQQNCQSQIKQCPDGNYVENTGLNCSFQPCEKYDLANLDSTLWTKYVNTKLGFALMVPKFSGEEKHPVKIEENGSDVRIYSKEYSEDGSWTIKIRKAESDMDLNRLIANEFMGEGCQIGTQTPSLQQGTFDVRIVASNTSDGPENLCGNFAYVLKYYPGKKVAAYWTMGQDNSFIFPEEEVSQVDQIMAASFEFIQ